MSYSNYPSAAAFMGKIDASNGFKKYPDLGPLIVSHFAENRITATAFVKLFKDLTTLTFYLPFVLPDSLKAVCDIVRVADGRIIKGENPIILCNSLIVDIWLNTSADEYYIISLNLL